MVKKTIKYTDLFDGTEKERAFYFNLTQAELSRMAREEGWYLSDQILEIAKTKDVPTIVTLLEDIVLRAYGERTPAGNFIKTRPDGTRLADEFVVSPAYDELYCELVADPEKFAAFVNSLIPEKLTKEVEKMKQEHKLPDELEEMM